MPRPRLEVLALSLDLIRLLRSVTARIERHDRSLGKQLRNAASSISLNLCEGSKRVGGDRIHFWRIAAGSAEETRGCLHVAEAWGYVNVADVLESLALLDSILAIIWRLTNG